MCYNDNDRPPLPEGSRGPASGEDLVLTSADGTQFAAYLALPGGPPTALALILPDVRGLHGFYKDLALRLAEVGVAAIGMDYFGRTAGLTPRDDAFVFRPHVEQTRFSSILADAQASLAEIRRRVGEATPGFTIGFCFGGTNSFFCGMEEGLGLSGVIGFYAGMARDFGQGTLLDRAPQLRVPALGLFGGADQGIPVEQVKLFDQRLDESGVEHEIIVYPGAPHSFFDRRAVEFADASADAWVRVRDFIAAHSQPALA